MKKIVRPALVLPTLSERANEPHPELRSTFPADWNNPDVRGALYAYHGWVCVYCQRKLTDSDRGDVEHFRPKSIYPWLAYEFTNYFLSCARCNRVLKKEKFPIQPGKAPVMFAQRNQLKREARLLADPALDPVEDWFEIDLDDDFSPWVPTENASKSKITTLRVSETVSFFRLNSTPDIVRDRTAEVLEVLQLLDRWKSSHESSKAELHQQIAERCIRFRPHGAALCSVVRQIERRLLPTPKQELRWLFEQFVAKYQFYERLLASPNLTAAERKEIRDRQTEIRWALAALWFDPPMTSSRTVSSWLREFELLTAVEPMKQQLVATP